MISIGNEKTYYFEGVHIPRIYINDVAKVRTSLEVVHKNGFLTNKKMAEETQRVRSEDIREILYLLWRLDFGIDVTKSGREIAFVVNEKLDSILNKTNKELKELILEKLKYYNPFIAVLDRLIWYRKNSKKFTEIDITKDFHNNRSDGGRVDNTHPLLRWAKDEDWKLVVDNEVSDFCVSYVKAARELNLIYFHHTVDLSKSRELNILAYLLSKKTMFGNADELSLGDIVGFVNGVTGNNAKKTDIIKDIEHLIKIGFPIALGDEKVSIHKKIYIDITPQLYVKFEINSRDGIDEIQEEEKAVMKESVKDDIIDKLSQATSLIIHDEKIDKSSYPPDSVILDYNEFIEIEEKLPKLKVNNIILPPGWKPLKASKINGSLLAFVRLGGNLVIFHAPMGRVGSNRNLFNWLPYDLARISFIHIKDSKNIKGFFTFPLGEKFIFVIKNEVIALNKYQDRYVVAMFRYFLGNIIFVGLDPSRELFVKYINPLKNKAILDDNLIQWRYRFVPALNRLKGINSEYDLYPKLKQIMKENFEFDFDPNITGKPGQTDLLIVSPFFCCCEVTPPNSNATGFSKVSEVKGHRDTFVYKDKKNKKKRFGSNDIGACVIGPSFTIEAGDDKAGAVDMANAMNVSLISYRDLYDLICINDKTSLKEDELEEIFLNKTGEAEASVKIAKIYQKYLKKLP